jgi:predicted kinase
MLIIFAGLPGTGKSTLARALAERLQAVYVRIDTIEQALRNTGREPTVEGYLVGYSVAGDNLRLGHTVVADSVNPIPITREAWRDVAARAGTNALEIEVVCSDRAEHRRRVETRTVDVPDLVPPSWQAVETRDYAAWDRPPIVIDTAGKSVTESLEELLRSLPCRSR